MRNVCKNFADWQRAVLKRRVPGQPSLATRQVLSLPLEARLFTVIEAFVELQEARNLADYDLGKSWRRIDALAHVRSRARLLPTGRAFGRFRTRPCS